MNLAIDGMRLAGQRLGVGRYLEYLLREWGTDDTSTDQFTVYVRSPLPDTSQLESKRVSVEALPSRLSGYLWQSVPLARRAVTADVLFAPSYRLPWHYPGPAVVAIHSVNEVHHAAHSPQYRLTHARLIRSSARRARKVIVPSLAVRDDVETQYSVAADRIAVVPQAADDAFRPIVDDSVLRSVRQRYFGDPGQPFVLWVGKLSRRRNIPLLLEAFAELRERFRLPHHLLLFGPNHLGLPIEALAARLGIARQVVQTDGIVADHRELVPLYSAADLYVNPSSYEGFSMTLVEAFSCGVPVVAVNRGGVAESARDCALLVDDPTVESLAGAMYSALTDDALRETLRSRALERANAYRWEDVARSTLAILHDAVNDQ